MRKIRLRETRKARGLGVRELADLSGVDHTLISRVEGGYRKLSIEVAEKLAGALNTTAAQLLGIDEDGSSGPAPLGLEEEATPYDWPESGSEMPLTLRRAARDTVVALTVRASSLDALGYLPGDVIFVDIGQAAVDAMKSGSCVIIQHYSGMTAVTRLRQFIAPALLTTNSRRHNEVPLNLEVDDVAIKGVITGQYKPRDS